MPTTLICGDIHVHPTFIERISYAADACNADRIIMLGDYEDYWTANTMQHVGIAETLHDWIQTDGRDIELLLGNHDVAYYIGKTNPAFNRIQYSSPGLDLNAVDDVHAIFTKMDFKIATTAINPVTGEQYLCSHAGLTTGWRNHNMHSHETNAGILSDGLNEMLAHGEWYDLYACSAGRGGHDRYPSPLWTDRFELDYDAVNGLNQIVGHTPVETIIMRRTLMSTLIYCDTMSYTSNHQPIGDAALLCLHDEHIESNNMITMHEFMSGMSIIEFND